MKKITALTILLTIASLNAFAAAPVDSATSTFNPNFPKSSVNVPCRTIFVPEPYVPVDIIQMEKYRVLWKSAVMVAEIAFFPELLAIDYAKELLLKKHVEKKNAS